MWQEFKIMKSKNVMTVQFVAKNNKQNPNAKSNYTFNFQC